MIGMPRRYGGVGLRSAGIAAGLLSFVILTAVLAGCNGGSEVGAEEFREKVRKADDERVKEEIPFDGMGVDQLIDALKEDSKNQVEPFNSKAYRILTRKNEQGTTEKLKSVLDKEVFFLGLLALHRLDSKKELYSQIPAEVRVSILTEALRTSKTFNAWGVPHLYWERASKVLLEEGPAAREALRGLLSEKREAQVLGSEAAAEARRYRYRVCDYAWALLSRIEKPNEAIKIPEDQEARDREIAAIQGR